MKKRDNKGFSLVELIVVVLIMAIIAVALAPQVMKWVEEARISSDAQTFNALKAASYLTMTSSNNGKYEWGSAANPIVVEISEEGLKATGGVDNDELERFANAFGPNIGVALTSNSGGSMWGTTKIVTKTKDTVLRVTFAGAVPPEFEMDGDSTIVGEIIEAAGGGAEVSTTPALTPGLEPAETETAHALRSKSDSEVKAFEVNGIGDLDAYESFRNRFTMPTTAEEATLAAQLTQNRAAWVEVVARKALLLAQDAQEKIKKGNEDDKTAARDLAEQANVLIDIAIQALATVEGEYYDVYNSVFGGALGNGNDLNEAKRYLQQGQESTKQILKDAEKEVGDAETEVGKIPTATPTPTPTPTPTAAPTPTATPTLSPTPVGPSQADKDRAESAALSAASSAKSLLSTLNSKISTYNTEKGKNNPNESKVNTAWNACIDAANAINMTTLDGYMKTAQDNAAIAGTARASAAVTEIEGYISLVNNWKDMERKK